MQAIAQRREHRERQTHRASKSAGAGIARASQGGPEQTGPQIWLIARARRTRLRTIYPSQTAPDEM